MGANSPWRFVGAGGVRLRMANSSPTLPTTSRNGTLDVNEQVCRWINYRLQMRVPIVLPMKAGWTTTVLLKILSESVCFFTTTLEWDIGHREGVWRRGNAHSFGYIKTIATHIKTTIQQRILHECFEGRGRLQGLLPSFATIVSSRVPRQGCVTAESAQFRDPQSIRPGTGGQRKFVPNGMWTLAFGVEECGSARLASATEATSFSLKFQSYHIKRTCSNSSNHGLS